MSKEILVVDNNPLILKLMDNFLVKQGHVVRLAESGLEAIEILKGYTPEVIFIDLVMPNIPGEKLCTIIRSMPKFKDVPLVVLSAVAVEQDVDFRAFGADACIAKGPFKEVEKHILEVFSQIDKGKDCELPEGIIGTENVFERIVTKELLSTKRHFEATLDHMAEGFIEVTRDLRIVYVNPVAAKLIGQPEEKVLSFSILDFFPDRHGQRLQEALESITDTPILLGENSPIVLNERQLSVNIVLVSDKGCESVILIMQDITERKLAEQELANYRKSLEDIVARRTQELTVKNEQLQKEIAEGMRTAREKQLLEREMLQSRKMEAMGTMAAGISHDFNNILTAVLGYTELSKIALGDSPIQEHLDQVLIAGRRAKDLIRLVLAFSRQREQTLAPLRLHLSLGEVLKLLRASTPSTIVIDEDIDKECGVVLGDVTQIHQIIMNLCTNAVSAMENTDGTLKVALRAVELSADDIPGSEVGPGEYIEMTFADTGVGMEPEVQGKIFDPYFTTKESGEGTGMGLAVVQGIVSSHGGFVKVNSIPGEGSTFTIYLPKACGEEENAQDVIETPSGAGCNEFILVVDDEEPVVKVTGQILQNLGYQVKCVTSAQEAFTLFEADPQRFDLVLTDEVMPNIKGSELTRKMRAIRPDIPIVLCTGYGKSFTPEELDAIGVNGFLLKPFNFPELASVVRKALT